MKVEGSKPNELNEFFSIYVILPATSGPGVYAIFNRNEYQKHKKNVSGGTVQPVRRADNLTATCEPTV
jgi:hypothetical protein